MQVSVIINIKEIGCAKWQFRHGLVYTGRHLRHLRETIGQMLQKSSDLVI